MCARRDHSSSPPGRRSENHRHDAEDRGNGHGGSPSSRDRKRDRREYRGDELEDRERRRDRHEEGDHKRRSRKGKERSDSEDDETLDLKALGIKPIDEEDYFLKAGEFKLWLKDTRGKYLDEMSSESAHKYFRKFVRRWNDGALREKYYMSHPSTSDPSSSNTAYKWSFASNRSRVDSAALAAARAEVDRLTHSAQKGGAHIGDDRMDRARSHDVDDDVGPALPSASRRAVGPVGPSLPTAADRQLALEDERDTRKAEYKSKAREAYNKADELVPKSGGKEGKMEEKKANNAVNREMRDKEVGAAVELDEGTLLGDAGGFQAALRARDAAQARRAEKKAAETASRRAADEDRLQERRRKESATMDMFKAMAKERFG